MAEHAAGVRIRTVEGIQGLAELMVFGAWERQLESLKHDSEKLIGSQRRMSHIRGLATAGTTLFTGLAVLSCLYLGVAAFFTLPGFLGTDGWGAWRRWLASPLMSYLGTISYGIFLWHLFVLVTGVAIACASIRYLIDYQTYQTAKNNFYDAIQRNELSKVQRLLHRYPSLIRTHSPSLKIPGDLSIYTFGETPLSVAVMYESRDTFDHLLSLHPDPADDRRGCGPDGCFCGDSRDQKGSGHSRRRHGEGNASEDESHTPTKTCRA